ncbi:LuxR C-terminal-related transcriptional regulator [Streptomyces capitiformicae]|uniref:DNA-binding response regulator n=1 Tax=Streptomyces capitiformicae TaxID=2014920 RepID=A0A919L4N9_9ACTN|nr:response regulator transcription factor [Streptomyces capitiformicae]GHH83682.1 DNA-binding response regulator [Streptomyces capitiformicae]
MTEAQSDQNPTSGDVIDGERPEPLRIFLIDDSSLVHAGLAHVLREYPDLTLVGSARDSPAALEATLDSSLDVLVINTACRSIDVVNLMHRAAHYSGAGVSRMLLLTNDANNPVHAEADKLGAGGVVLAWEEPQFLVSAIRLVSGGYRIGVPDQGEPDRTPSRRQSVRHTALDLLTLRERQVLKLLARGMKNAEIAGELVVSESTVKTHVQNLLIKLGLRNRASAVAVAYELGITRAEWAG